MIHVADMSKLSYDNHYHVVGQAITDYLMQELPIYKWKISINPDSKLLHIDGNGKVIHYDITYHDNYVIMHLWETFEKAGLQKDIIGGSDRLMIEGPNMLDTLVSYIEEIENTVASHGTDAEWLLQTALWQAQVSRPTFGPRSI